MPIPVGDTFPTALVTLDDVRAEINSTSTADDAELQGFIDGATPVIEAIVGTVLPVTVTDEHITDTTNPWPYHYGTWPRYTYGVRSVVLRRQPVLSVTSVSVSSMDGSNAYTMPPSSYRLDQASGMVTVIDSSAFGPMVTVTYMAGRATVPRNVRSATLELIRTHWQPQQAGAYLPGMASQDDGGPGMNVMGYFVPNRVMELLTPSGQGPVVA